MNNMRILLLNPRTNEIVFQFNLTVNWKNSHCERNMSKKGKMIDNITEC